MEPEAPQPPDQSIHLAEALGAGSGVAVQCFTVYIPNKDKNDREIGTQRRWVLDAIRLLSEINGGATAIPVGGGGSTTKARSSWSIPWSSTPSSHGRTSS